MSIERLSQVVGTHPLYWKVRVQILEDIFHGRYSSGSEYDPAVRCCERGNGLSISVGSLFYVACVICRVGGPLNGYGLYEKRAVRK